jgi:hypothetical protein
MVASRDATLPVGETGEAKRKGSDVACNIFGGHPLLRGEPKPRSGLSLALRQGQRPLVKRAASAAMSA